MAERKRAKKLPSTATSVDSSRESTSAILLNTEEEVCSDEPRKRILDAAQTLFAAHGFHATTTKAIAQQAGVPAGLTFYYFPTKKALLQSVIDERNILVELRDVVDTLVVTDPRSALIMLGARYLELLKQHEELASILLREFRSHPEVAAQFHALREEQIQLIASYLQASLQAGQHKPVKNIQEIARVFLYNVIVIGIIEDPPDPLRFIEDMADILLCSLLKNGDEEP